jgi:Actinobacteria/chloroflexi VLRF1 release factor
VTEQGPNRTVSVSWRRLPGWIERYDVRHPGTRWLYTPTRVTAESPDGSVASFEVPLPPLDRTDLAGLVEHLSRDRRIGLILVRRGGFAVALLAGGEVAASKVGRRHVQGRTKAGGWSQQRFARRRDNQARAAFDAAGAHVLALLVPRARTLDLLVTGGDRAAVDTVVALPELSALHSVPRRELAGIPDPTRGVLGKAVEQVHSVDVDVADTLPRL